MRLFVHALLLLSEILHSAAAPSPVFDSSVSVQGPRDLEIYERGQSAEALSSDIASPDEFKNFVWFTTMAAVNLATLGGAFTSVVYTCRSYDQAADQQYACVWGSIATAGVLTGLALTAIKKYVAARAGRIYNQGTLPGLGNHVDVKKLSDTADEARLLADAQVHFGSSLHIHGYLHRNSTLGSLVIPEGYEWWPVAQFTAPDGNDMHILPHVVNGENAIRMGYAAAFEKRGGYDNQYFTNGGIDFKFCEYETSYRLSKRDWGNMYDAVKCYFPRLESNAANIDIFEEKTQTVISRLSISLVKPRTYDTGIGRLSSCPLIEFPNTACEKDYQHLPPPS